MVTAAWPVAPAAAWISTVWPAATWPSGRSAASAVGQLTTRPRACSSVQPAGTGTAAAAASTRYSAKAPPVMLAPMTWSPAVRPVTPAATVTTSPAASRPARYGGRGPSGNVPRAWEMSTKLTPAAVTRMRISPGPAAGTGTPVIRRRSRGPFSEVCSRARMVAGTLMVIVPSWYGRTAGGRQPGRPGGNGKGIVQGAGGNPNTVTRLGWPKEDTRRMPALVTVSTQIPYGW